MIAIIAYILILFGLSIYSYALMDPNITFFNSSVWTAFREPMVYLGYYQRQTSTIIYLVGILLLFGFYYYFTKKDQRISPLKLGVFISSVLFFSYPFLSHDIFNYLFDAKIVTFYHQNPYLKKALDFPHDPWTRFMHWTHRTYPYGPFFLVVSLVPSFLSMGKFILAFFSFKLMFIFFYLASVFSLQKMNRKWAFMFATNPLVLVEGLMNTHNDLLGIGLVFIGLFYLHKKNEILGRVFLLLSIGIKYVTFPFIIASRNAKLQLLLLIGVIGLMTYWVFTMEIQPWYFLLLFGLIPYFDKYFQKIQIFIAGLLFSYVPYIWLGGWDKPEKVAMKHNIIWIFFGINLLYLVFNFSKRKFFTK